MDTYHTLNFATKSRQVVQMTKTEEELQQEEEARRLQTERDQRYQMLTQGKRLKINLGPAIRTTTNGKVNSSSNAPQTSRSRVPSARLLTGSHSAAIKSSAPKTRLVWCQKFVSI
jgi:hypothetical protein